MAETEPLSNLPELVPAAVFMEDVNTFMQGEDELAGVQETVLNVAAAAAARRRQASTATMIPPSLVPFLGRCRTNNRRGSDRAAHRSPEVQVH